MQLLKVGSEADEHEDVRKLRRRAIEAALGRLHREPEADTALQVVLQTYRARLDAQQALSDALHGHHDDPGNGDRSVELQNRLREVFQLASAAERELVLNQRSWGQPGRGGRGDAGDRVASGAER